MVCGEKYFEKDDSDILVSDENIRKVYDGMQDSVRFVLNPFRLQLKVQERDLSHRLSKNRDQILTMRGRNDKLWE